jgi:chemotaxis protein methyltransferase CheR
MSPWQSLERPRAGGAKLGAREDLVSPLSGFRGSEALAYAFDRSDFERVRRLIYASAGISLGEQKLNLVYNRLVHRLRKLHLDSFRAYLDRLEHDPLFASREMPDFVNALTTNLTSFFREGHHFATLAAYLGGPPPRTAPQIWCAASSTGEEPYSIAMTMLEAAKGDSPGRLLASDIDTQVLATASRAAYKAESAAACGEARLRRFFQRGTGGNAGQVRLQPHVRKLVQFAQVNLLDRNWPQVEEFCHGFDAIFCRNVMIYFDRHTQCEVLRRILRVLRPGGLLFVGHSENFADCHPELLLQGRSVYRRERK